MTRSSLDVDAVDALLSEVPASFHTAREFNPFSHYDDSVDELTEYSDAVREAIELVVDAHYKGFNQATAAFTHVVHEFNTAQSNVQRLSEQLVDSKRRLTTRNDRLREHWQQTQTITHINTALAKLTYLVTLPAHMAQLESHSQYLHCVVLISHTLTLLSDEDMREVEGLLELREDIINRRNNIVDALLHHTQQLIYHKHRQSADAEAGGPTAAAAAAAAASTVSERDGSVSALSARMDATPSRGADGSISGGSDPLPRTSSPISTGSISSTLAFLTSNELSPFHPSNCRSLDFALPADSSVLSEPSWRPISALLEEERSAAFLSAPFAQPQRALFLVVAALDHINALPSAKLQLSRAVRQEVAGILSDVKQRIRLSGASMKRKRIVAEGGAALSELSPSFKPLASPTHPSLAPLSPAPAPVSSPLSSFSSSASSLLPGRSSVASSDSSSVLPRVSDSDRLTLGELLARVFASLLSALRMFGHLIHTTAMVQSARRDMQAAQDAAQQLKKQQQQQQQSDKKKAAGKKDAGGSTSSSNNSAEREDSRWSLLHVWSTMQIELQVMLQELLSNSADSQLKLVGSGSSTAQSKSKDKTGKAGSELELSFSFDDAAAPSIARMSRAKDVKTATAQIAERRQQQAALRREQRAVVPPSPYNITALYRPVVHFCRQVQLLCVASVGRERDVSDASAQLLSFMTVFVQSSFMPRLQADVNIRLDAVLADEHAFDEWDSPHSGASQHSTAASLLAFFNYTYGSHLPTSSASVPATFTSARLQCVVGVCELVVLLLSDAATLPSFASEYVSVVDSALNRLQTACHDRYVDVCRGVYSTGRLMDSALVAAMEREQPYLTIIMHQKQQQQREEQQHDAAVDSSFSSSNPLYAPFLSSDFSLRADQLLSEPRHVAQLCLLHSSLEWLCDQLHLTLTAQRQHEQPNRTAVGSAAHASRTNGDAGRPTSFRLNEQRLKEEEAEQPPTQHNSDAHDSQRSSRTHKPLQSVAQTRPTLVAVCY